MDTAAELPGGKCASGQVIVRQRPTRPNDPCKAAHALAPRRASWASSGRVEEADPDWNSMWPPTERGAPRNVSTLY
jgi:hypothetical protein